jgi:hypothetical protein
MNASGFDPPVQRPAICEAHLGIHEGTQGALEGPWFCIGNNVDPAETCLNLLEESFDLLAFSCIGCNSGGFAAESANDLDCLGSRVGVLQVVRQYVRRSARRS